MLYCTSNPQNENVPRDRLSSPPSTDVEGDVCSESESKLGLAPPKNRQLCSCPWRIYSSGATGLCLLPWWDSPPTEHASLPWSHCSAVSPSAPKPRSGNSR